MAKFLTWLIGEEGELGDAFAFKLWRSELVVVPCGGLRRSVLTNLEKPEPVVLPLRLRLSNSLRRSFQNSRVVTRDSKTVILPSKSVDLSGLDVETAHERVLLLFFLAVPDSFDTFLGLSFESFLFL